MRRRAPNAPAGSRHGPGSITAVISPSAASWILPPRLFWTATAAAGWTAVVWGNRIGLITSAEAENAWAVARIAGSLAFVALLGAIAWRVRFSGVVKSLDQIVLVAFLVWNLAVWVPSLISVLPGDFSLPFKIVHVILATGSLAFGAVLFRAAMIAKRTTLAHE